jgi:S1-C subfamily serine protease
MLVCLLLLCPARADAQQTPAPPTPQAQIPPPSPTRPAAIRATTPTPRAPRSATNAPAASAAPAAQTRPAQPAPGVAPLAPLPPQQVVTVVHRLRGWKLLAWLAANGPPGAELDELPSMADAHTNIVAGYVSNDGRTIIVRLPQAEAELESFTAPSLPSSFFPTSGGSENVEAEFTLVMSDNRRIGAKFVGLDSSTGLSLLEASERVLSVAALGEQGDTEDPTVGQRVRLYAPTPVAKPAAQTGVGFIYLSIDQKEGRLTEVRRGPSGKTMRVVARANVTPEWTGAVAANELGEVVGIVSHSGSGETQIVPVATMLGARERVLKLRGSAPQPWLGVRGDASFQLKLNEWVSLGWKPELALPHIQNGLGVFLTAVVPGTPAALAGLRPGDVIESVGARKVRSVEDLSFTLNEAGVGSTIDFTVWRAFEPSPLKLSVLLKGARNPALATAIAEQRAGFAATPEPGRSPLALASLERIGLHTIGLTARIASRLSAKGGLLIVAVRPESPAAASGLRAGDVIETVNGETLTRRELSRLLFAPGAQPVSLGIIREGRRMTLTLTSSAGVEP